MAAWANTPVEIYNSLRQAIKREPRSDGLTALFLQLGDSCLDYLGGLERIELISMINNKTYFSFNNGERISRAINSNLFADRASITSFLNAVRNNTITELSSVDITKAVYTLTASFAGIVDIINRGDQKTPATYYEYLVSHLITKVFNSSTDARALVNVEDEQVQLTLDLVLERPSNHTSNYHIAIKNSTRERATEFWAHQRVLDAAFNEGTYKGILFALAETKLDHRTHEVIEICVPYQWRVYQKYIAKVYRIYYLDPPNAYLELNNRVPKIPVKYFGDFFHEIEALNA